MNKQWNDFEKKNKLLFVIVLFIIYSFIKMMNTEHTLSLDLSRNGSEKSSKEFNPFKVYWDNL